MSRLSVGCSNLVPMLSRLNSPIGICLETFACSSGEALKYVLLSDAKKDLEQTLSKFSSTASIPLESVG